MAYLLGVVGRASQTFGTACETADAAMSVDGLILPECNARVSGELAHSRSVAMRAELPDLYPTPVA
jgi:hypothetical protein